MMLSRRPSAVPCSCPLLCFPLLDDITVATGPAFDRLDFFCLRDNASVTLPAFDCLGSPPRKVML